jgi:hypothetical protein
MEQSWFEMRDIRRRRLTNAVWIPLRASLLHEEGRYGYAGYKTEFFGLGSLMVPLDARDRANNLAWSDIGLIHEQRSHAFLNSYKPADVYQSRDEEDLGVELVLVQVFGLGIENVWHLHQDLVIVLELLREGDSWVCPNEGFVEVARVRRNAHGREALIEIRAEFLRDYLAARRMALKVSTYRDRHVVLEDAGHITWPGGKLRESADGERFEAHVSPIHEGGDSIGAATAMFKMWRTDVDLGADVPVMGEENDTNVSAERRVWQAKGLQLWDVRGEVWIDEWLEPAAQSPRVRGDDVPSPFSYIIDGAGTREAADKLNNEEVGRWLWFAPGVIPALAGRRGFELEWYTRETGGLRSPGGYNPHFGINDRDLITVYAYDIARLPEWQQRIWNGFNVAPDGGVSTELLEAQVKVEPANTAAPEQVLGPALEAVDEEFRRRWGRGIFREHKDTPEILSPTHRLRATGRAELLALAKDLARLTADSIDVDPLHAIVPLAKVEKRGSLKSLERVLATVIAPEDARRLMSPLFGVYDLRHGDAHMPSSDIDQAFRLVGVDQSLSSIRQGEHLIGSIVHTLFRIAEVIAGTRSAS